MPISEALVALNSQGFSPGRGGAQADPFVLRVEVKPDQIRNEAIGYATRQVFSKPGITLELAWTGATAPGVKSHMRGETLRSFEGEGKIFRISRFEVLETPSSVEAVIPVIKERFGVDHPNCETPSSWKDNSVVFGIHVNDEGLSERIGLLQDMRCTSMQIPLFENYLGIGTDFGWVPTTSLVFEVSRGTNGLVESTKISLYSAKLAVPSRMIT